jgi:perosamine synthetase
MSDPAPRIPLCVPQLGGNEWTYVKECLDTGWVSSVGPFVTRFEASLAARVGAPHAVAVVNGTAALHVALLVAGVEPDDEVLLPTLTFIAPANAVRYAGAWPVFVDVEAEHWQLDVGRLEGFLAREYTWSGGALRNRGTGRRLRALLPVDVLGHPVDMEPLCELARRHELRVVEDATEALGATYRGRPLGTLGDVGCFSFNGNKVITSGGGGMLVTSHAEWAARARYLTTQAKDDPVEFVHNAVGYNYRLTNVLAALGCAQLERLQDYVQAKRRIAARYRDALADVPGLEVGPREAAWANSSCWMTGILIDQARFGRDRRALAAHLAEAGVETRPLWRPLHQNPVYAGHQADGCPVAERLNRDVLTLPSSVGLTPDDQERVISLIRAAARPGG